MNLELIENILEELSQSDAQYLKIEDSKKKIEIIRNNRSFVKHTLKQTEETLEKKESDKPVEETQDITAPFVGFFLRGKSSDSIPNVKLREVIEKDKIVAYIKSMNLLYDVVSDFDGKIIEVLVEDGQAVEYGQPLFRLKN